ncbi:MAG: hypothetical protein KKB51_15555 [Candidatus Riflebacteria bacterium]|nr:hypothetical protein [Candidatus Riflebacteria bacterium]
MELIQVIGLILILTAMFAIGGKIVLYLKKRELDQTKEKYDQQISELKKEIDMDRAKIAESGNKVLRMTEDNYQRKLDDKDQQIQDLVEEIEGLKSWKEEMGLMLAKFEGASHGNERILFKLFEHNQKLNRALNAKWHAVEENLGRELNATLEKIKGFFSDAEKLHHDGIEIISEYESRLPEDFKRKVHEELLQLPESSGIKIKN